MTEKKMLVFDMDGTIADLYGVSGWLDDLRSENARPYEVARPIYNMVTLRSILCMLRCSGWKIVVTSWLAKGSSRSYDEEVRNAKRAWLDRYEFPYDEIHLVKYGTTKANCTRRHKGVQILIDDNAKVREGWTLGNTINPQDGLLIERLRELAKVF